MSEKILLAQLHTDSSELLYRVLRNEGYFILRASDLPQTGRLLRERPDLLLLDTEMAEQHEDNHWGTIAVHCQKNNLPCLLYSSNGRNPVPIKPLMPWVTDILPHPIDPREVRYKVAAQLAIRRLSYEVDMCQRMLLTKQQELDEYRHSAAQIQRALLPEHLPAIGHLQFAWRFLPCEKVGGDLFNIVRLADDTVMVYLLDVSGHGVSAAMVTVSVFQSMSPQCGLLSPFANSRQKAGLPPSPAEVLRHLDREYPLERFGKFFTMTCLQIHPPSGRVCFSSAGHPPPVLARRDGSCETLPAGGSIIGAGARVPFEEGTIFLQPGDRLFLYSDGIIEHANRDGDLFGMQRLLRKLDSQKKRALEPCCEKIIEALQNFGQDNPLKDDVTLVGIEYRGKSAS
jgi:sigma-B regulation protein RsbU (phosphoserine phosphatase)